MRHSLARILRGMMIKGDQALGVLFVTVQGEGDTGPVKQQVSFTSALLQQLQRGVCQPAGELLVMRSATSVCIVHFIEKCPGHTHSLPPLPAASLRFIYVFQGVALRVGGCCVCGKPRIRSSAGALCTKGAVAMKVPKARAAAQ